jgi:hypothetical protein
VFDQSRDFNHTYLNAWSKNNTSIAFSVYADLYVSAGWPAVVLGMIIMGALGAFLYTKLLLPGVIGGDSGRVAFYMILALGLNEVEGLYVTALSSLPQRLLFFGAVILILFPSILSAPRQPKLVLVRT